MSLRTFIASSVVLAALAVTPVHSVAEDWPMWRYDAGRTAASPEDLADELHLLWERQYAPRTPVWDDPLNQDLMPYDRAFEPVVLGDTVFLGFNDSDKLVALDAATGEERWACYVDGPVRLPPVAWNGKVYFGSDDGYLYCLDAGTGAEAWRFQAAPQDRRLLGNRRLISMWPVRGGPVIADGTLYFGASIWPVMGVFLYALDAETGEVAWVNDGNGARWTIQPHNSPSFSNVAPQGAFVVAGERLLVPGGRSVPACFDRATGAYVHYRFADNNKTGGSFVCAQGGVFFSHHREGITALYDVESGDRIAGPIGRHPVLTESTVYFSGSTVRAVDATAIRKRQDVQWELPVDASGDLIKAGRRLYAGGDGRITALDLPGGGAPPSVAWTKLVHGKVERLVAAGGRLIAVTLDGRILAFGPDEGAPRRISAEPAPAAPSAAMTRQALALIDETGVSEGYALLYGVDDAALVEALAANSRLHLVVVLPDREKVDALRRRFDAVGLSGERVAVHQGEPGTFPTPPYLASLTVVKDWGLDAGAAEGLLSSMRPYGGVLLLTGFGKGARDALEQAARAADPALATTTKGNDLLLVREGPLPGAGVWTHMLGDAAQSGKSDDQRVKLPLGVLWFGGSSNLDVLTRHGHGPPEQVVGGRLFIEGMTSVSARDVYTGRVLWRTEMQDLGTYGVYFDETYKDTPTSTRYNQVHIPGANVRGTNFVATLDSVYVIQGPRVHVLDAATGATKRVITLPAFNPEERRKRYPPWGYIAVYEDTLFGGAGFAPYSDVLMPKKDEQAQWDVFDKSASKALLAMDRHTGDIRWKETAAHGFLHNGIAIGDGTLFCLDKLPPHVEKTLRRRGKTPPETYRLLALDVDTGKVRWHKEEDVFGSFLTYSAEHHVLIQATRASGDTVAGESGTRMIAYRGKKGKVLWDLKRGYQTFPLLHGDRIITESGMLDLLTGEPLQRPDLLTGTLLPWVWDRNYGCNYPVAAEHLLTFRSGAAGFYDLAGRGGTGNVGGFRSSCTSNLVVADGVLNAPDYTRTCSCAYQNQTSLALIHMPDVEFWTYNNSKWSGEPVKQVGINFGAPGDRSADDATLWLDYPSEGGPSPDLPVKLKPESVQWFRHHSARMAGEGLNWVAASGAVGVQQVTVTVGPEDTPERACTVRLHFAEWEDAAPGDRVFDVSLQGNRVAEGFDIIEAASGPRRAVVREFSGIQVGPELAVGLAPRNEGNGPVLCGVEMSVE